MSPPHYRPHHRRDRPPNRHWHINHVVENSKLEKARLKAELNDWVRRCAQISESLPGQFVSPSLKLLMSQIELSLSEQQLALQKKADAGLKARIEELRALVAKGESIPVRNPPQAILTEDKAKEVRFLSKPCMPSSPVSPRTATSPRSEAQIWVKEIRHLLVRPHIEFFGVSASRPCSRTNCARRAWLRTRRPVPAQAARAGALPGGAAADGNAAGPRQRDGAEQQPAGERGSPANSTRD